MQHIKRRKSKIKLILVVGARPQFIKVWPLLEELNKENISFTLVHTGQHYDYEMSCVFFEELTLSSPDINLEVGSYTGGKQTALILMKMEELLLSEQPTIVIVFGDTNSTLGAGLAAVKAGIPLAHIEAGLRSYNKSMPEEVNRLLIDHISEFLFTPTLSSVENLYKEGIIKGIYWTGDIMYDAFLKISPLLEQKRKEVLNKFNLSSYGYYLLTLHRASNVDNENLLNFWLTTLGKLDKPVVFPVHPRTGKKLEKLNINLSNFILLPPVSYVESLVLQKEADKVLTDSGGVQKEAYWNRVPCITLREETEWIETVEAGWNKIIPPFTSPQKVIETIKEFTPPPMQLKFFGEGNCAKKCVEIILKVLK